MNKIITTLLGVGLIGITLSGCGTFKSDTSTTIVTQQRVVIIEPPRTLYRCPQVSELPDPDTLTNQEVANIIVELSEANSVCKTNIDAIRDYVARAKANVERRNQG